MFVLTLALGLTVLAIGPAIAADWEPVVITSGSMEPTIRPGDIVLSRPASGETVEVGAIVVFHDPNRQGLVTHRVDAVNPDGRLVTKGDANQSADSATVDPASVVGSGRFVVPRIGTPLLWLGQGRWAALSLLGLAAVACVWATRFGLESRFDPWAAEPHRAATHR